MSKATGGGAFPYVVGESENSVLASDFHPGMTLRDWFAGQALLRTMIYSTGNITQAAYEIADMMILERDKLNLENKQ